MDKPIDDSNWREDFKGYTSNKLQLDLLENGPKIISQSLIMQAMYNKWKKIHGIVEPEPPDCSSNLKDSLKKFDEIT